MPVLQYSCQYWLPFSLSQYANIFLSSNSLLFILDNSGSCWNIDRQSLHLGEEHWRRQILCFLQTLIKSSNIFHPRNCTTPSSPIFFRIFPLKFRIHSPFLPDMLHVFPHLLILYSINLIIFARYLIQNYISDLHKSIGMLCFLS